MSPDNHARRALPDSPSAEHLRKQAKRLAKTLNIQLALGQRRLASDYGFPDWRALMAHVRGLQSQPPLSPLAQAARSGDVAGVRRLLADGCDPDEGGADTSPIWEACSSKAAPAVRLAIVEALLAGGASARKAVPGSRPLHAVAARGPIEAAELLVRHGAIDWEPNTQGRSPLDIARRSPSQDQQALIELLDRPVVRDPSFRAAIDAVQSGDAVALARLLDAEPRLLEERVREPDCYRDSGRDQYFLDPKLFWFIANNPTLVETMPSNMVEVARVMIARGVSKTDLDYALGLVMTSSSARGQGLQTPLVRLLVEAGAAVEAEGLGGVLAHGETEIVEQLVAGGLAMTAPVAAALERLDVLPALLKSATQSDLDEALDLAVINNRGGAAKLALEAGANPDRFSSHHRHSQPLHQAALHDNLDLVELLLAHGAKADVVDRLWGGTPAGWAHHAGNQAVMAYLATRANQSG